MPRMFNTPEDDPNHWAIGRYWRGAHHHVNESRYCFWWCDSHEEHHGFWLTEVDNDGELVPDGVRKNVSERAMNRTFLRPKMHHHLYGRTSPSDDSEHPHFSLQDGQERVVCPCCKRRLLKTDSIDSHCEPCSTQSNQWCHTCNST